MKGQTMETTRYWHNLTFIFVERKNVTKLFLKHVSLLTVIGIMVFKKTFWSLLLRLKLFFIMLEKNLSDLHKQDKMKKKK